MADKLIKGQPLTKKLDEMPLIPVTKANLELHQQDDDAGAQGLDALTLGGGFAARAASSFAPGERASAGGTAMAERKVRLRLNQQQLELIDNTVKAGERRTRAPS